MNIMNTEKQIHARARVIAVDEGGYARVLLNRKNTCGGCSAAGHHHCGVCLAGSRIQATVINAGGAKKGDIVMLSANRGRLLQGVAVLYLLPVAAVMLGAVLGHNLHSLLPGDQTLAAVLFSLAGAIFGLLGVRKIAARMNRDGLLIPFISKILSSPPGNCTAGHRC